MFCVAQIENNSKKNVFTLFILKRLFEHLFIIGDEGVECSQITNVNNQGKGFL